MNGRLPGLQQPNARFVPHHKWMKYIYLNEKNSLRLHQNEAWSILVIKG